MSTGDSGGLRSLALALLVTLSPGIAQAAAGAWQEAPGASGQGAPVVRARLIAAVGAVGNGETVPLGLHLKLQPEWKTYWRSPGDAGLPPALDWAGSGNVAGATMAWPAPVRFTQSGLETFGYENEVVLPLTVRLTTPGAALAAQAGVDLLVCHDVCIPQHFDLSLDLPAGPAHPDPEAALLARFTARVPSDGVLNGLGVDAVRMGTATGRKGEPVLEVEARSAQPFASPDVVLELEPPLALGAPELAFGAEDHRLLVRLPVFLSAADAGAPPLVGRKVVVTLTDGTRAMETTRTVAPAGPTGFVPDTTGSRGPASGAGSGSGLAAVLLAAVLGGMLLNLMPCVLPVLSLKLMSVLSHGGGARGPIRRGFLATAAGILTSFLVLAIITAGLKTAGVAVGWGLQFQQPLFLLALIVAVTLFACNLWGLFEIFLPSPLADLGAGSGADRGERGESLAGAFATGAFATLLATPCSAPFLGTAVGFALARGTADIIVVFLALGVGLASPYLVVAAWPGVAAALPRPGHWMLTLRRILAVVLAGTGAWLLLILSALTPPLTPWLVAALMAALAGLVALRERLPGQPSVPLLALLTLGVSLALPGILSENAPPVSADAASPPTSGIPWQPFALEAIPGLVAQGKVVFVDVTADWCLTCKVNERLVLARGESARRLSAPDVVPMRADWTRPDPVITRFLAAFGRYGIPFYIAYGPGAPQGLPLPELITDAMVTEALRAAAGKP